MEINFQRGVERELKWPTPLLTHFEISIAFNVTSKRDAVDDTTDYTNFRTNRGDTTAPEKEKNQRVRPADDFHRFT
jgi:hypothetical protein